MPTELLCTNEGGLWFTNVSSYSFIESQTYGWQITYDTKGGEINIEKPIYYILDSMNHAAFCHWVYENAMWIPEFLEIKKKYPSCKLVLEEHRQYKQLFLDFYGIPLDSVCLHKDIQTENICFFHTYTSLNDVSIPSVYYKHIQEFENLINSIQPTAPIPLLYLPRGNKENLQGPNNRSYNIQDNLKEFVKILGGTVYETDKTVSILEQIRLVKSAKVIVLDYGSNLWVNGFFSRNSKILCMNIGWNHHNQFPSLHYIWEQIHKASNVIQVFAYPSEQKADSSEPIVCFHMPTVIDTLVSLLDIPRNAN